MISSKYILNQCVATIAVTCGIFGLGTVLAWSSPALPDMVKENGGYFHNISAEQQSWVGSIATLGALASSSVAGFTVERLGRKGSMLLFSLPFILGWMVVAFSRSIVIMCIGRFITGFCGGVFSLCAPLYIGETVSSNIRGMLLNAFQLMMVTGILLTYIVGTYVPWKTLTLISGAIPIVFLFFAPFIPESPAYLLKKGQLKKAERALHWLQGPEMTSQYLESVENEEKNKGPKATFRDLLTPEVFKPLVITLTLMILEQASAFNVVIFYCVDIFTQAGTGLDSYWSSIIVAGVQVVATISGTFLVDRAGRRVLLILSEFVMGISFVALGAFFYIKMDYQTIPPGLGWLPLVSVAVFIVAFSIGIGPLSWTVMGEILHPDVKGLSSAIATSFVWLSAFVVTKIYQTLVATVGIHWSFWIFSSVSLIGTVIVYLFVPETKGKTLEQIQKEYFSKKPKHDKDRRVSVYSTFNLP